MNWSRIPHSSIVTYVWVLHVCVNDIGSLEGDDDIEECWVLDLRVQVGFLVL